MEASTPKCLDCCLTLDNSYMRKFGLLMFDFFSMVLCTALAAVRGQGRLLHGCGGCGWLSVALGCAVHACVGIAQDRGMTGSRVSSEERRVGCVSCEELYRGLRLLASSGASWSSCAGGVSGQCSTCAS